MRLHRFSRSWSYKSVAISLTLVKLVVRIKTVWGALPFVAMYWAMLEGKLQSPLSIGLLHARRGVPSDMVR
jgi:hypothetical protein